jgi:hypothetical protein
MSPVSAIFLNSEILSVDKFNIFLALLKFEKVKIMTTLSFIISKLYQNELGKTPGSPSSNWPSLFALAVRNGMKRIIIARIKQTHKLYGFFINAISILSLVQEKSNRSFWNY